MKDLYNYNRPVLPPDPPDFWDQVVFYSAIALIIIVALIIILNYL